MLIQIRNMSANHILSDKNIFNMVFPPLYVQLILRIYMYLYKSKTAFMSVRITRMCMCIHNDYYTLITIKCVISDEMIGFL